MRTLIAAPLAAALLLSACTTAPDQPIPGSAADTLRAASAWLRGASTPVPLTSPADGDPELTAVRVALSGARVIGLGEATHGTHEFGVVKHRMLQTLVREGRVASFVMEVEIAEARDLDRYVRDGVGDPVVLLSRLNAVPWNSHEVLDLIRWLRAFNAAQPAELRVGFGGMDMHTARASIDSVKSYAARVDPGTLGVFVSDSYSCFDGYATGASPGSQPGYYSAPATVQAQCAAAARAVADTFARRSSAPGASEELTWTARYAQAVRQWEEVTAVQQRDPSRSSIARDRAMAENALWWAGRAGANTRTVLWAHDFHVSRQDSTMGQILSRSLANTYVPVGFAFDDGSFLAVAPTGPNAGLFAAQIAPSASVGSYEEGFRAAASGAVFVDLRAASAAPENVQRWLSGPRTFHQIGIGYDPAHPTAYEKLISLPAAYDAIVYIPRSTPTLLLASATP